MEPFEDDQGSEYLDVCTYINPIVDDHTTFKASLFKNSRAIKVAHHTPFRFGHPNEILNLIEGTKEEGTEYLKGVVVTDVAIFIFFALWGVVLLVLRCYGPKAVGGWSGRMKPLPKRPHIEDYRETDLAKQETKYQIDLDHWTKSYKVARRRFQAARYAVIFAGCAIIVNAVIMATLGVESLVQATKSSLDGIEIAQNLTLRSIDIIDATVDANINVTNLIRGLKENAVSFCPFKRDEYCEGRLPIPPEPLICNWNAYTIRSNGWDGKLEDVLNSMDGELDDFYGDLKSMKEDLKEMETFFVKTKKTISSFNWAFHVARVFGVLLAILCLVIMLGLVCRRPRIVLFLDHCVTLPLFTFLVVLCFVFSLLFILGSVFLADFCVDQPDTRVLAVLETIRESLVRLLYDYLVYYVKRCPNELLPINIRRYSDIMAGTSDVMFQIWRRWKENEEEYIKQCGEEGGAPFVFEFVLTLSRGVCTFGGILADLDEFLGCVNFYPVYEHIVFETLCYNSSRGFIVVGISQFIIVFMANVVWTARCAFHGEGQLIQETAALTEADADDNVSDISEGKTVDTVLLAEQNTTFMERGELWNAKNAQLVPGGETMKRVWVDSIVNTPVAEALTAVVASLVAMAYAFFLNHRA